MHFMSLNLLATVPDNRQRRDREGPLKRLGDS